MTFTSFNRGGSFQPVQVSSPLQAYDENVRKQQAAESQYLAAMRANDRARIQDLQLAFSGLEKISTSITKYAEQKRDEYQKKEMQRECTSPTTAVFHKKNLMTLTYKNKKAKLLINRHVK